MTVNRQDIEEGAAAWARKLLRKPEPGAGAKTEAQRVNDWVKAQALERAGAERPVTGTAVERTRSDLVTPGSAFTVGAERYAADGTRWQRVA
ncbi:hypothetical protein [Methylobacterium sp. A54F]